jgi:hypothetical protein
LLKWAFCPVLTPLRNVLRKTHGSTDGAAGKNSPNLLAQTLHGNMCSCWWRRNGMRDVLKGDPRLLLTIVCPTATGSESLSQLFLSSLRSDSNLQHILLLALEARQSSRCQVTRTANCSLEHQICHFSHACNPRSFSAISSILKGQLGPSETEVERI